MPYYPPAGGAGGAAISGGTQSQNTGTVIFSNGGGISFGLNNGTMTATVVAGAAAGIAGAAAGTQTQTSGTLVFANSNGAVFGMSGSSQVTMDFGSSRLAGTGFTSTTTAGTEVKATNSTNGLSMAMPAFLTTAMQSQSSSVFARTGFTSTTTAGTAPAGTLNTNGLSMAFPNVLTTARASNDAVGLNTAQTNVTWTVNSSGISLNAGGYAGTGFTSTTTAGTEVKATNNTAGLSMAMPNFLTTAMASNASSNFAGTGTTFNGANISGSMTMNTAGLNLSLSVAPPGGGGGTLTLYANSNTTQSSTGTANVSSLNFAGAGAISVGITNGSVVISGNAAAGDGVNIVSMLTSTSGGGTAGETFSAFTGSIGLMAGSNITLSQTSNTIVFNAHASSSLVGSRGISISTNGSTISVYDREQSYFANFPYVLNTQSQTVGQSTSVVFALPVPYALSCSHMQWVSTVSIASTSFASTAATSYSYNQQETFNFVLYSRGVGASSQSLQSVLSTSAGLSFSIQVSQNTTNNISVTHGITYPVQGGTSTQSFSYAATNSSMQISTTHMTALSGLKLIDFPLATLITQNQYWMAYGRSTAQTTQQTAALSAARLVHSHLGISQVNLTIGNFGQAAAASVQWYSGIGSFTTNAIQTTASLGFSAVSSSSSHIIPFVDFIRVA